MSLEIRVAAFATAAGTDINLINGVIGDFSGLNAGITAVNITEALNFLHNNSGGVAIDDSATATNTTWSSTQISSEITQAIFDLTDGAPAALDTLNELAAAVNDDVTFSTSVTASLGNRVRFDAAQTLTAAQQLQASQNIGVGDPEADFLSTYITARDA